MFHYIAEKAGVLSNPCQQIKANQKVSSPTKLNHDWLVPYVDGKPARKVNIKGDLPPMANMMDKPKPPADVTNLPDINDPHHDQHKDSALENTSPLTPKGQMDALVGMMGNTPEGVDILTKAGNFDANKLSSTLGFQVSAKMRDDALGVLDSLSAGVEANGDAAAGSTEPETPNVDTGEATGTGDQDVI